MTHTVLVVDKEPVQRDLLTYSLQNRLGYRVITAPTAEAGKHCFYTDHPVIPDLILLNGPLPGDEAAIADIKSLCIHAPLIVLVNTAIWMQL